MEIIIAFFLAIIVLELCLVLRRLRNLDDFTGNLQHLDDISRNSFEGAKNTYGALFHLADIKTKLESIEKTIGQKKP